MSVAVKDQLTDLLMAQKQELADAQARIDRLQDNVAQLLRLVAKYSRRCDKCPALLWFVYIQKTDKSIGYEFDGTPHQGRCRPLLSPRRPNER